jgi:hypothetical protein
VDGSAEVPARAQFRESLEALRVDVLVGITGRVGRTFTMRFPLPVAPAGDN